MHPGQEHTVTIDKLTFGGAGLAHIHGKAIFVPGTLPGQQARITITKIKDNHVHAKLRHVERQAPEQIKPRCQHFGICGGCTWQHLSYQAQLNHKEQLVRETLTHLTPADRQIRQNLADRVRPIIPSPREFYYRNKLELSFGYGSMRVERQDGQRIYHDEDRGVGLHRPGEWATIVPLRQCHLYDEHTDSLLLQVRQFMQESGLHVYNPKTHKGVLRTLLLRRGIHTGEHMIALVVQATGEQLRTVLRQAACFATRPNVASLLVIENHERNDRPRNPICHTVAGEPFITEQLCGLRYQISPFSFFQTNTLGAEELYQTVAEAADLRNSDVVLDAYCGMATIGQFLARSCRRVIGIDNSHSAIQDARRSAGHNDIANITLHCGTVEDALAKQPVPSEHHAFDVAVVDPPRAGLHATALKALIAHAPRRIVYVSCNTATFARDLGPLLAARYRLQWVRPVDMFPHTAHIETVAALVKG
ncbi:MAG: 23S rRNA (uracil(1939)-C(5))-methyltransferase RlmD [Myxococcota bacterium]